VFSDVPTTLALSTYTVNTRPIDVHRPSSLLVFPNAGSEERVLWNDIPVVGPDVNRRETLVQLAKMANNAYNPGAQGHSGWYDLGPTWNTVGPFPFF
jgi:lipase ATG15